MRFKTYRFGGVCVAKLERYLKGDFYNILHTIHEGIMGGSISASFEEESHFDLKNGVQVVTRVYERYSYLGGNRVSLTVTLAKDVDKIHLSAITSGGSQAVFFKINTFGESTFLDKISQIVDSFEQY